MIEIALYVGLMTTHITPGNYNEENRLIAVEAKNVLVGRMENSLWNESYFAAYNHRFNDWSGVLLGVATGYDYSCMRQECQIDKMKSSDIVPIAAPYAQWKNVHLIMQFTAINISYRFGN